MEIDRRHLLIGAGAGILLPSAIARARSIDADVRTGTIKDVGHVVILMQENRGFDHYFGAMPGVRGFGDRFPIPSSTGPMHRTIWTQAQTAAPTELTPFHLDTVGRFDLMCAEGTPHTWPDAQAAWDEGRMSHWPDAKTVRAMGHYMREDIPFQYALADAFTICDAYHCAMQTGTNSNRLFLWSGTNDPAGTHGGPAIGNSHDSLVKDGGAPEGYRWTTYMERLQAAGIDWRIYQDMADNFSDNPLAGFQRFRDAHDAGPSGPDHDLIARGLSTHTLDQLRADVMAGTLPQVSYIVSDARSSEHPAASSPAQGADYTARVLDALTANPAVWSRTVLLVMFDENDGFFDHVPPPAPPSRTADGYAGASTVSTESEYHLVRSAADAPSERPELIGRPYGLGPRVPLYAISPWSRGGWVNSEVFDHTSVIRFLERRFGVEEPNISPWRRTVCGDLTSAFDFKRPNKQAHRITLPDTTAMAVRAAKISKRLPAAPPDKPDLPVQALGVRRSRALGYSPGMTAQVEADHVRVSFSNSGELGAVFQVYDRLRLTGVPRRYTVGAGQRLDDAWQIAEDGRYDLWVLGPNGFHRHVAGHADANDLEITTACDKKGLVLTVTNGGRSARRVEVQTMAYAGALQPRSLDVPAGGSVPAHWPLAATHGWYDLIVRSVGGDHYLRRFAGRIETGCDGLSDPAMGGPALLELPV